MNATARLLLALLLVAAGCRGSQEPEPAPAARPASPPVETTDLLQPAAVEATKPAPVDDAERTAVLDRVALVGASATSGFGAVISNDAGTSTLTTLSQVFAAAVNRTPPPVITHLGHIMFFNAPMDIGPDLVSAALDADPTLVIGVDYLFWYGHGSRGRDGRPITDEMDRLDLLDEGLAQLERFECPVVVGDYPDVTPAIGFMISAAQVPDPDTREILNARVREWAAERPNVIVLPFAQLVESMRANEGFMAGDRSWPAGSEKVLVQPDRLHPTTQGLIAIVQMVVHELLLAFPELRPADFELDPDRLIERLTPTE